MDDCLERTQSMVAMTKLKPTSSSEDDQQVRVEEEKPNGGDGLVNQLISDRLPTFESNANNTNGDLNSDSTAVAADQETKQEENIGGGGLMDQLVSNLPSVSAPLTFPDDPAPDPEEASLLIHIVKD